MAWGANDHHQIEYPGDLTDAIAIAAGDAHSVAVRENGTVVQWGEPWDPIPSNLTNAVAVPAADEHTLALRSDGTVSTWGSTNVGANWVPTSLTGGVAAVACGRDHNLALLTNGSVVVWGQVDPAYEEDILTVPDGATNGVTAIAANGRHSLALRADGTVVAWGVGTAGETWVPDGLSNVIAIAAGSYHNVALKSDGTVAAWGWNGYGQTNVPAGLSNVMAVAAGWAHSAALKNDGTLVCWGDNSAGQTTVPTALGQVKLLAAGGDHTLAVVFSPLVQYPVDVSKDLLLIYNTNSSDSIVVKDYYLAHRPMVSSAATLGVASPVDEVITSETLTNQILAPYWGWLALNPTKHPGYVILFLDIPSRVHDSTNVLASVSFQLHEKTPGIQPFVTAINMATTNDCIGYIDKLAWCGSNYSAGRLILGATVGNYSNTNYLVDNVRHYMYAGAGDVVASSTNGLISAGVATNSITYLEAVESCTQWVTNVVDGKTNFTCTQIQKLGHITNQTNVAGYISWGAHSSLGGFYAVDGTITWTGASRWWIIETIESFNGVLVWPQLGHYPQWFSASAFGGASYLNTPVAAVTHVDEPGLYSVNDSYKYFNLWASGRTFAIAAWNSRLSDKFQAVGDPLVTK